MSEEGMYNAGEYQVGDRVRVVAQISPDVPVGATGTVIRVDTPDEFGYYSVYPVIVRLDHFPAPVLPGPLGELGFPVCDADIEAWDE